MYQILKSLRAVENKTLTESAEPGMNEIADADFDADALTKHKARLAREKNRMSLSMPKPGGGPRKSDVPAAARAARGEAPLSLKDLDEADGKEIDYTSLEVDGIDYRDAPDFSDAYFSYGEYADGTEMTADELDQLSQDGDLLRQHLDNKLYEVDAVKNKGVEEAAELYGPFTVTINTGERPKSRTKTKQFNRKDEAILWTEDWLEDFPQYVFVTAQVTAPDGNVVWNTEEGMVESNYAVTEEKVDYAKGPDSGAEVVINGKPAVVLGEIPAQRGSATYYAVQYKGQQYPTRQDGGKTFDQVNVNLFYQELPSFKNKSQQSESQYDVGEGNEFSGKLARARAIGAEDFEVDGKKYAVKESKKAKPDFLDLDGDGDTKETMKKAAADKKKGAGSKATGSSGLTAGQKKLPPGLQKAIAKKKSVKESIYEADQEGPADLLAAVEEEKNNPGKHIDNLTDVLNATFGSDRSPEFKHARAAITQYLEFVTNADVDHPSDDPDDDEPMIRAMTGGNIARHIQDYDLIDYLEDAAYELSLIANPGISESYEMGDDDAQDMQYFNAIAALYGPDIWDNDGMADLAQDLADANPSPKDIAYIISNKKLPRSLANVKFSSGDQIQFGDGDNYNKSGMKASRNRAGTDEGMQQTLRKYVPGYAKGQLDKKMDAQIYAPGDSIKTTVDKDEDFRRYKKLADKLKKEDVSNKSGELSEDYSNFFDKKMAYQKIGATVDGSDSDYTVTFRDGKRKRYMEKNGRRQVTTLSPVDRQDDVDDEGNVVKRGRGRPAGPAKAPERTTAKAYKHKGVRKVKEADIDPADRGEYDREGDMAMNQLHQIADAAEELHSILNAEDNLPEWVQSKITKAVDYLDTARDYLKAKKSQNQHSDQEAIAEKAVSRSQQKAAGAALAAKRGKGAAVGASKEMAKMGTEELEKIASTKHKGLPDKKKTEAKHKNKDDAVEETTTSGSVATSGDKPAKANSMFGKGVYEGAIAESYDRKLSSVLTESMSINTSTDDQGQRSITITATDAEADQLAELLKMSGLGSGQSQGVQKNVSCAECGGHSGLHEDECPHSVNEEYANEPNAQYGDMEMLLQTMAGGVNGPKRQVNPNNPGDNPLAMKRLGQKASGQVDLGAVAEGIEKETQARLWDLYKRYQ